MKTKIFVRFLEDYDNIEKGEIIEVTREESILYCEEGIAEVVNYNPKTQKIENPENAKFSLYHNGIKNTIPNGELTISKFLEMIKQDNPLLDKIRKCTDKDERNKLKSKLSYVTFAGTFKKRAKSEMIKSSGYACLDVDDVENLEELTQKIISDKYTHCLFVSPSGNGLKILVKIPKVLSDEEYKKYWLSISKQYNLPEGDESTKDISRACFFSYDPNPYFNPDSEVYTNKIENNLIPTPSGEKDTSRSGFEFGKLCQLIRKQITKETVFFEMNKYSKWNNSSEQYKELSYKKALVQVEREKEEKKEKKASEIFTIRGQATEFIKQQPIFYDNASIWWVWNKDEYKWEMSDDVDILNKIHLDLQVDTISSKSKTEIITALKQIGRLQKPKAPEKTWVQFKSRIFDFSTGKDFEATPDFLITNPLPFEIGESEDTPTITELFDEWVGKEYSQTLFEILAYACSADQSLQTIIALTGSGSNGKGTFLQLLTNFIGKENVCSSELKTLALRNFETSALYKKLVCQMGEVDTYDLKNTNLIKQLSGEDLIRYEFKGKNPFSDYSSTTCIIATNSLPITPDKSIGFYRRWLVVDFPKQFAVVRNILGKIPQSEYNNLSRKILGILKQLYDRGSFTNGGTFDERMKRYEERSNPIQKFIDDFCDDEPSEKIKLQDFSREFNKYLKTKHLRLMSVRQIGKALREEGFEVGTRTLITENSKTSAKVVLNLKFVENTETTETTETKSGVKTPDENKGLATTKKKSSSGSSGNSNKENTETTKTTKLSTHSKNNKSLSEIGGSSNKGCLGISNDDINDTFKQEQTDPSNSKIKEDFEE